MNGVDPQIFKSLAESLCPAAIKSLELAQSRGECGWDVLVEEGWVHPERLLHSVAEHFGMAVCTSFTTEEWTDDLLQQVSACFAKDYQVLPWKREGSKIWLLTGDFLGHARMDEVRFMLGTSVAWAITTPQIFKRALGQYCIPQPMSLINAADDKSAFSKGLTESRIEGWIKSMLSIALQSNSIDVHFELQAQQLTVRARQPRGLSVLDIVSAAQGRAALTRLKLLAGMDIAQKPWPQEGRFEASVLELGAAEFRACSLPIVQGESLVLRILRPDVPARGLESLGLGPELLTVLWGTIHTEEGLFLFTGPTGSGKTTTVYALLCKLNEVHQKLVTVEDPVEYTLEGALQLQVQDWIGLTFPEALKALLRHDPDTIMVGEIRDSQTAQMAVQAALTGHRVLATLHTQDPVRAILRLIDLGVQPYLIAATLKGVVAQRLICPLNAQNSVGALSAEFSWLPMHPQLQGLITSGSSLECMRQCIHNLDIICEKKPTCF